MRWQKLSSRSRKSNFIKSSCEIKYSQTPLIRTLRGRGGGHSKCPYYRGIRMNLELNDVKSSMLGSETNPVGIEFFSYGNDFFYRSKFA